MNLHPSKDQECSRTRWNDEGGKREKVYVATDRCRERKKWRDTERKREEGRKINKGSKKKITRTVYTNTSGGTRCNRGDTAFSTVSGFFLFIHGSVWYTLLSGDPSALLTPVKDLELLSDTSI